MCVPDVWVAGVALDQECSLSSLQYVVKIRDGKHRLSNTVIHLGCSQTLSAAHTPIGAATLLGREAR
jgi:hypothetical protein